MYKQSDKEIYQPEHPKISAKSMVHKSALFLKSLKIAI